MSNDSTMVRTQLAVNEAVYALAQGQDLSDLKARIESAVQAGGRFETFTVVGNREVCVLFSTRTAVTLSVETVLSDIRDRGELDAPFGGLFDF